MLFTLSSHRVTVYQNFGLSLVRHTFYVESVGQCVDFSANAPVYDRRHGAVLPEGVAQELVVGRGLVPGARVLDVGAGTGRVAAAFAGAGYPVTAVDPAPGMLNELRVKAQAWRMPLS
jgi:ubiquinone/menaquinone biosynthesis C-methylase UbiE